MFLALIRRIFLFAAFTFLVSFSLIFVHALQEGDGFSWLTGVGAGAAIVVLALSWMTMLKTDDYLTPPHARAFLIFTSVLVGIVGFGLFGYFMFSDEHASSYLFYFGIAPAGVAALFIFVATIRMKEAFTLPAEYRPETIGLLWRILPMVASIPALAVSAGILSLTLANFGFKTKFDSTLPDRPDPVPEPVPVSDTASRQISAHEIFQLAQAEQQQGSYRRAFELFHEAAALEHAEADYELALIYSGDGYLRNLQYAHKHFESASEKGHLEATFRLGKAYRHGEMGFERDPVKARVYLENAAAAGHLEAQTQTAHLYNRGEGVEIDLEKAFYWFLRAAEQGDAVAQNDVGIFYLQGKGVETDAEQGIRWLILAADQGVSVAEYNVGRAFYSGELVPQDYDRAYNYFKRLSEKNIAYGFQMTGQQYFHGHGPAKNKEAAFRAFAQGAARNDTVSQYYLGYSYLQGLGTERNSSAALNYLHAAADKDHAEAQNLLGQIYLTGSIILQDKSEAAKWFTLATSNGSEDAANEMEALKPSLTEEERAELAARLAAFRR